MKLFAVLSLLAFAVPLTSANPLRRLDQEVANRARADVDVHKRDYTNARFTWFDVGLGACGAMSQPTDWVVALSVDQFGPGYSSPHCFKKISISTNGVNDVNATIVDKCPGCSDGGLDLSLGLFEHFALASQGVIYGEWHFI